MKIATWNVNGLRAVWKKGKLQEFVTNFDPDILCIQETKSEENQLTEDQKTFNGYNSFFESSRMRKGYSGVAVYSKTKPIKSFQTMGYSEDEILDNEGRTIIQEYEQFYLANCYFPNGGKSKDHYNYKLEYYKKFLEKMVELEKTKPVIFMGDVNAAHEEIDLARPKENEGKVGFTQAEREALDIFSSKFCDIWRSKNPDKIQYTWWDQKTRARERNVGWRIDYIFLSRSLLSKVSNIEVMDNVEGSDHCPMIIELTILN